MAINLGLETLGMGNKPTEASSTEAIIDLNGAIVIANMSAEGISLKFDKVTDLVNAFDTVVEINRCVNVHNKTKSLEALYDAGTISGACEGFGDTAKKWFDAVKKFFIDIFNAIVEWFKQLFDKNAKLLKQLESVSAEFNKKKNFKNLGDVTAKSWTYQEMNGILAAVQSVLKDSVKTEVKSGDYSAIEAKLDDLKKLRSAEVKEGKLSEKNFDSAENISKILDEVTTIVKQVKDDKKYIKVFEANKDYSIKNAEEVMKVEVENAAKKQKEKVSTAEKEKIEDLKKSFKASFMAFKAAEESAQAVAAQILSIASKAIAGAEKKK